MAFHLIHFSFKVWPKGKVVFPDFLKNETCEWWKEEIIDHHKVLSFDGLWIVSVNIFVQ